MTPTRERLARGVGMLSLGLALLLAVVRLTSPTVSARQVNDVLPIDVANSDSAVAVARTIGALIARGATTSGTASWPSLFVPLHVIPSHSVRAVLSAAAHAGLSIRWIDSSGVRALALDVSGVPMPRAATLLAARGVSPKAGASLALTVRDAAGMLDSVCGAAPSLRIQATRLRGPVTAQVQRNGHTAASASASVPPPVGVRRVLLTGRPSWETKFVVAGLEEMGWLVDGSLTLSPTARVRVGAPAALDTARYSVAVVLDSGLANPRELRRFIGQGGGVVFAGEALRDPMLAPLLPARVASDRAVVAGALLTDQPRRGLLAYRLRPDRSAIMLEHEGPEAVVVVARRGAGRVLVSGYRSTWRWRMEGLDGSVDAHRQWWNDLVSAVAFAPAPSADDSVRATNVAKWPGDVAPVADLIARLGVSSAIPDPAMTRARRAEVPLWWLFAIATVAFLCEWALRRMRGVR